MFEEAGRDGREEEGAAPAAAAAAAAAAERKKDQRDETQGRLLAERRAAWRGYRTSNKAATVTGKRGSIYYLEYYSYFYPAYSTEGHSCKVCTHLYIFWPFREGTRTVGKKKKK